MEQDKKDLLASRMNPFLCRNHSRDLSSVMDVKGGTKVNSHSVSARCGSTNREKFILDTFL